MIPICIIFFRQSIALLYAEEIPFIRSYYQMG